MDNRCKIQIYKGMIDYLIQSKNFTLKDIAVLANTSIKNLRSIFLMNQLPKNFKAEFQLVKLFEITLEIDIKESQMPSFVQEVSYEYLQH